MENNGSGKKNPQGTLSCSQALSRFSSLMQMHIMLC
jgi:hypothetical protein